MTTRDDMPDDPLAGVDLQAWQPPAPPAAQVDSILARLRDGTRTDVASAVEVDGVDPARPARGRPAPQRSRWVAIGIIVGAAAAVLIVLALQARDDSTPEPSRTVVVVPPPDRGSDQAGGTVVASLDECRAHRDAEDWIAVVSCGKAVLERSPANDDARDLIDQATREARNKLHIAELQAAADAKDYTAARAEAEKIAPDSIYATRANGIHARLLDELLTEEVSRAKALAKQGDCDEIADRAKALRTIYLAASDAVLAVSCTRKGAGSGATSATCDANDLLQKARAAGGMNEWRRALKHAEASNACMANVPARQIALLAACNTNNTTAAKKYWKEFENNLGMQQRCVGVIDAGAAATTPDPAAPTECDAVSLLNEARAAGGAAQWSKVLAKAEASNKCVSSKSARQLALLAACNIGDKSKALKYWKEFENNTGMQQRCTSVIK